MGIVSCIPYLETACRVRISHSRLLSSDFTGIALTFSSPFCPLPSLSQVLHPLGLVTRHFGISQSSAAACKEQEETSGKIRYSTLESLDGPIR